jgi:fatty acid desaturase
MSLRYNIIASENPRARLAYEEIWAVVFLLIYEQRKQKTVLYYRKGNVMELANLLPIAVKLDKAELPDELLEELKTFKARRPGRFVIEAIYCWIVIFGAISAAVYIDHWIATVTAIFIVATRQNVLALLVHEQTHCTAFKSQPGDLIANLLAAYPLLILSVEGYAQIHLTHHAKYFTEQDPDHRRKSGEEWNYPMEPMKFFKILLGDLIGLNVLKLIKGKKGASSEPEFSRGDNQPK